MTKTTTLPDLLRLTDPELRATLEALPASVVLIGIGDLGTDGQAIAVDLDAAAHVLVCTGSGGATHAGFATLCTQ